MSERNLEHLKNIGEAEPWLTEEAYNTLCNGYLKDGETPNQAYRRVANYVSRHLYRPDLSDIFYDIIKRNWLCPSTPVLSNSDTRNLTISCFSGKPADDLYDIGRHLTEMMMLTKYGGGVGSSFDTIRAAGETIGSGGQSGGTVPFLKMLESVVDGTTQGRSRRGSVASYMNAKHGDVERFLDIRSPFGDTSLRCLTKSFHNAIVWDDDVMEDVKNGTGKWRSLWNKSLTTSVDLGEPYFMFSGNANKNCPDVYKGRITQSNLCLSGETFVKTSLGEKRIVDLVDRTVKIHDGNQWVDCDSFRHRGRDVLYRITYSSTDGEQYVDATANHRWLVNDVVLYTKIEKHTDSLKKGDLLATFDGTVKRIISIEELPGVHDVYCPTVPSTSFFVLSSGIITGNCNEIFLPVTPEETFVCCLSSLNLSKYREWENWKCPITGLTLVQLSIYFLDGVMSGFIQQADKLPGMENAVRFAKRHRALGLGVLGWHTFLQQEMVAFEGFTAMQLNSSIFKKIRDQADQATYMLGNEYGECEETVGTGRRNTVTLAVAPTMSNSVLSGGVSQGIEPITANIFAQKSAKGTFIKRNPQLQALLSSRNKDTFDVWEDIDKYKGSVQHLKFLTDEEKDVFKTAREINQYALVRQAAQRQKFIDMGQSLNLFFAIPSSKTDRENMAKYINGVHLEAYDLGVKGRYYLKTASPIKGQDIVKTSEECVSCEG